MDGCDFATGVSRLACSAGPVSASRDGALAGECFGSQGTWKTSPHAAQRTRFPWEVGESVSTLRQPGHRILAVGAAFGLFPAGAAGLFDIPPRTAWANAEQLA